MPHPLNLRGAHWPPPGWGRTPRTKALRLADAARQRRRRRRAKRREIVAPVVIGEQVLDVLVELRWLADSDAADRTAIGKAIGNMLLDLAKHR